MLDYQNTSEQMTHQHNSMISYQNTHSQPHPNPSGSDSYYNYSGNSSATGRQPFSFNTAPLAALHSMTDMKPSQSMNSPPDPIVPAYNPTAYYSMNVKQCLDAAAATPHGISDILSRPDLQAQLQARLGQGVYYNNSSCSQTTSQLSPASLRHTGKNIPSTRSLYHWPNNSTVLPSASQTSPWHSKHGEFTSLL